MAKSSNGLGKFSGKLGGSVFVIRNGQQVIREYNAVPANPKTDLQTAQRAKGNLVGRISSFTPKAALFGLGSNAPARRSQFLKILLKAATVTKEGEEFRAKVADDAILFSTGAVVSSVNVGSIVATANNVAVSLTGVSTDVMPADVYASHLTRMVVMVYDGTSGDLVEVSTRVAVTPAQGAAAVTNLRVAHAGSYDAVVYLVPMSTADGSAMSVDTSVAERDDNDIAASLSLNGNAVVFEYGRSQMVGQGNFTTA